MHQVKGLDAVPSGEDHGPALFDCFLIHYALFDCSLIHTTAQCPLERTMVPHTFALYTVQCTLILWRGPWSRIVSHTFALWALFNCSLIHLHIRQHLFKAWAVLASHILRVLGAVASGEDQPENDGANGLPQTLHLGFCFLVLTSCGIGLHDTILICVVCKVNLQLRIWACLRVLCWSDKENVVHPLFVLLHICSEHKCIYIYLASVAQWLSG